MSTVAAARWVSRIHASITQPVNNHASGEPPVGSTSGRANSLARSGGTPTLAGSRWSRCANQASHVNAMSTP